MKTLDLGQVVPVKGIDYWTDSDEQQLNDAVTAANAAKAIAEARVTSYVFGTEAEMNTWLSVADNQAKLNIGDNFYIRATDVPDYWWDGTKVCIMETTPIDLSDYVKRSDVEMMLDDLRDEQFAATHDLKSLPLTIEAMEDDCVFSTTATNLQVSHNLGTTWTAYSAPVKLAKGQRLSLMISNTTKTVFYNQCTVSKKFKAMGNPLSMTRGSGFESVSLLDSQECANMFRDITTLVIARNLSLSWLTIASRCYQYMFSGCTSLVNAPKLPATTIDSYCYYSMFSGCTSLVNAPKLPALSLEEYCYGSMFKNCTKLSFVNAMFITDVDNTGGWLSGVSPTGTFIKNSAATWDNAAAGIPSDWAVETAEA